MIKGTLPTDALLRNINKKIRDMIKDIPQISFWHVMKKNNRLADSQDNLATLLPKGTIEIMGYYPITQYLN
jgi:hypothetical protein